MPDGTTLPGWPAIMRAKTAAAYLDISVSAFHQHIGPKLPKVRITSGIVGFRKTDLDRWVATHGESPLPAPADDLQATIEAERRELNAFLDAG